jgi:putative oxidoreductase
MYMLRSFFNTPKDCVLTFMRIMMAVVFFPHGAQKLLGWFGGGGFHATMGLFGRMGIPAFAVFLLIFVEFFCPLALFAGFLTRLAALAIAFDMFMAVMLVHRHVGFFMNWAGKPRPEGYEFHLLAFAVAIPLIIRGGGSLSLDRAIVKAVDAKTQL